MLQKKKKKEKEGRNERKGKGGFPFRERLVLAPHSSVTGFLIQSHVIMAVLSVRGMAHSHWVTRVEVNKEATY